MAREVKNEWLRDDAWLPRVKSRDSQFSRRKNRRESNSSVEKSMPNGFCQNANALLIVPIKGRSNSPFVRLVTQNSSPIALKIQRKKCSSKIDICLSLLWYDTMLRAVLIIIHLLAPSSFWLAT